MTVGSWIGLIIIWLTIIGFAWFAAWVQYDNNRIWAMVLIIILAIGLCIGSYAAFRWYHTSTASGIRALTDERSDFQNGLERTITVYTSTGQILAQYKGKIDLEMDQDYIKFDWQGKRYIYYNCFVETIADIQ